jgi:hypothetical protein
MVLDGVDWDGVHPLVWLWLGKLSVAHRAWTAEGITVTSLRRPVGPRPSKHSPLPGGLVEAADIRRWALDRTGRTERFCRELQRQHGGYLGVVLEPEWLTPAEVAERGGAGKIAPHIHLQLKLLTWPPEL